MNIYEYGLHQTCDQIFHLCIQVTLSMKAITLITCPNAFIRHHTVHIVIISYENVFFFFLQSAALEHNKSPTRNSLCLVADICMMGFSG